MWRKLQSFDYQRSFTENCFTKVLGMGGDSGVPVGSRTMAHLSPAGADSRQALNTRSRSLMHEALLRLRRLRQAAQPVLSGVSDEVSKMRSAGSSTMQFSLLDQSTKF